MTMTPTRLPDGFTSAYAEAALGRKVSARKWLDGPDDAAATVTWPLRATDIDLLGHVNNAAYWHGVEEHLLGGPGALRPTGTPHVLLQAPYRAVMEFGAGIAPGAEVQLAVTDTDTRLSLWFTADGTPDTSVTVLPLPS
jgi:acyl-ACP thioesterase